MAQLNEKEAAPSLQRIRKQENSVVNIVGKLSNNLMSFGFTQGSTQGNDPTSVNFVV